MSTSTSRKPFARDHTRTPSFSAISTFSSTFSSAPSSPEYMVLPLAHTASPPASPPREHSSSPAHYDHLPAVLRTSALVRWNLFARGLGTKSIRSLKRSDYPLVLVFVVCCFIFFQALSGRGYQDPDGLVVLADVAEARPGPDFQVAMPLLVEEPVGPSQKELEEVWKTMKRGKTDGAWLLKARDKRVVRRNAAGAEVVAPKQEDRPAQALVTEEQDAPVVVVEGSNESTLTILTDDAEEDDDDDEPADALAPAPAEAVAESS